jgi:hypothetical protein
MDVPPPKLLNDDQMKDYITNGYLALPVATGAPGNAVIHTSYGQLVRAAVQDCLV